MVSWLCFQAARDESDKLRVLNEDTGWVGAGGAALGLFVQTASFSRFCRETGQPSYFALGQGPVPITSLWRIEEAGPSYSLPSRAYASHPTGLAWLWLETNGQGGGVNETLRDEVDVVCQSSLSHQNATQSILSSHLAISGVCCLTPFSGGSSRNAAACRVTDHYPKYKPL